MIPPKLVFTDVTDADGYKGRTRIWTVACNSQELGRVRWWSHWRRYTYHPNVATVYDPHCMRQIADFCEERTRAQREEHDRRRSLGDGHEEGEDVTKGVQ